MESSGEVFLVEEYEEARNGPDYMVGGKGGKGERGSVARRLFALARAALDSSELASPVPFGERVAHQADSSP